MNCGNGLKNGDAVDEDEFRIESRTLGNLALTAMSHKPFICKRYQALFHLLDVFLTAVHLVSSL